MCDSTEGGDGLYGLHWPDIHVANCSYFGLDCDFLNTKSESEGVYNIVCINFGISVIITQ